MRALLYAVTFLIIYGSLYPFIFKISTYEQALLTPLFDFALGNTGRGDMISNVLLFMPFGFLALHCYPGRNRAASIIQILLVGFLLAYLIQVAQLVVPSRTPSGSDALWNLLGCGLGCALACLPLERHLAKITGPGAYPPIPLVLGLLWLAYNWAPFVPSLDLQLLKHSLKSIASWQIDIWWLFQKIVMWQVIFHFLHETESKLGNDRLFPLIVAVVLGVSLFISGHTTSAEHVAGGVLSIPVWYMIRDRNRAPILAVLLVLAVLTTTFTPFELREETRSFRWIPFSAALGNNLLLNVLATFKKLIVYGSMIWLLHEAFFSLRSACLTVAAILFASEMLQGFFRGPTPEITDPLLALAIGVAFYVYESARAGHKTALNHSESACDSENVPLVAGQSGPAEKASQLEHEIVELKLHAYQASFLAEVAAKLGWTESRVCSELVALKSDPDILDSAIHNLTESDFYTSTRNRNARWVSVNVSLANNVIKEIEKLTSGSQQSNSNLLRQLIKEQITALTVQVNTGKTLLQRASSLGGILSQYRLLLFGVVSAALLAMLVSLLSGSSPSFETAPAWAGRNATVTLDFHTHTSYSDGYLTSSELVDLAIANGCDALAITDHSDAVGSASSKQLRDVAAIRRQRPAFLLLAGIELNMPSYNGREHVSVITEPKYEAKILRSLGDLAESKQKNALADELLLEAISQYRDQGIQLLTIYNHPSRKAENVGEVLEKISRWDHDGQIFSIMSGAPGHRKAKRTGSYKAPLLTEDRWDPAVAAVGGVWDQLLGKGYNIWGAFASSDYHNQKLDEAPCSFSRTHVALASRTPHGLLEAMRAGTFWADHGQLLNQLKFSLEFEELEAPAYPGSIVNLDNEPGIAVANLTLERDAGSRGSPLQLEIISSCNSGKAEVVFTSVLGPGSTHSTGLIQMSSAGADEQSCFVRARVRLHLDTSPDLLAYTNPIRILL